MQTNEALRVAPLPFGGRRAPEEGRHCQQQLFYTLAENSPDAILRHDLGCRWVYVNSVFSRMTGVPQAALIGRRPSEFSADEDARCYEAALHRVIADGRRQEVEYRWAAREEQPVLARMHLVPEFDAQGRVSGVMGIGRDIGAVHRYETALRDLSIHDKLTGLSNRVYLEEYLGHALAEAGRLGQRVGLLLLDLDRFKEINEIHGHSVGDRVLAEQAGRLRRLLDDRAQISRLGGDEFAVVPTGEVGVHGLAALAGQIVEALAYPVRIDGTDLFSSTCVGIALYPEDGTDVATLRQFAETALYDAKKAGRGQYRFYSRALTERMRERMALEHALREAVPKDELILFYQPKVDMRTTRMCGVEALLRWRHPRLGMIAPDRFVELAEDTGLIVDIGQWVLREACVTARLMNLRGGPPRKVAVNLSPGQFRLGRVYEMVERTLAETGCAPAWIELEVTENLLLDDDRQVLAALSALRGLGITLAIDDFGTGYSALAYLKRFPINVLKIDRSFVRDMTLDADSAALVKAIIAMARSLRLEIVAEGVEKEAEENFLLAHGCRLAQGYRYGKPKPVHQLSAENMHQP